MHHMNSKASAIEQNSRLGTAAFCIIVLLILSTPLGMRVFAWTAFFASVFGWIAMISCIYRQEADSETKSKFHTVILWFAACLIYFLLHALQYKTPADIRRLDSPARLFAFAGIALLPLIANRSPAHFCRYFSIAGITFGSIALWQHLFQKSGERAFGFFLYQNLMGLAAVINAAMIVWYNDGRSKKHNILHLFGIIGSFTACFLSGTRGSWILLPIILVPGYVMYARSHERKHLKRKIGLALILTVFTVFMFASDSLYQRVHSGAVDLKNTLDGDASGSIGLRLIMVNMSIEKIQQNPIVGNGLGDFHESMVKWADLNKLPAYAMEREFQNPHNQFLHWAQALGIPAALLCIFICILWPLLAARGSAPMARNALASFMACCIIFFFTEAVLDRYHGSTWFAATVSLILGFCLLTSRTAHSGGGGKPPAI
jgi:O-antigen ligase